MPIEITMPRLSDTMESGTVLKWNASEGDEVSSGDVIADVETDKATMEMQVYDDGTLAKIVVAEGETVDVGTVIAILAEDDEDTSDLEAGSSESGQAAADASRSGSSESQGRSAAPQPPKDEPAKKEPPSATPPTDADRSESGNRTKVTPVARHLADEHGIDLKQLQGSGPGGRIIKRDVLNAVEAAAETSSSVAPAARADGHASVPTTPVHAPEVIDAPVAAGLSERSIALSNMRQTIARRLVESKQSIPHYQVTMTFDMDPILELRKSLNVQLEPQGVKLSVNDFLMRACALAMYEHPEFNASWAEDSIQIHGDVNIGMAISLPAERGGGLVVGVIKNADRKSLRVISAESKALAKKARERGLSVEDMSDSTFTLSNLGMFGVEHFTAIINPPNSAILAVGAAIQKPVVRDGELAVGHEMSATLSNDHRVIDGALAAQYLKTLKEMIESPAALLV